MQAIEDDLTAGIDVPRAVVVDNVLTLQDIYAALAGVHGWSPDGYERWLAKQLVSGVAPASG